MNVRALGIVIAVLAAATAAAIPAAAGDAPKEGTCHFKSTLNGSGTLTIVGTLQDGGNGLLVFDETGAVVVDCGQGQAPTSTQHCFGVSEMRKGFMYPTGYCITTEPDRDQIVWKMNFEAYDKYSFQPTGTQEALIGSGKYEGMTAQGRLSCALEGGRAAWTDACEGDFSYKRK